MITVVLDKVSGVGGLDPVGGVVDGEWGTESGVVGGVSSTGFLVGVGVRSLMWLLIVVKVFNSLFFSLFSS